MRDMLRLKKGDWGFMEFRTTPVGDTTPYVEICDGKLQFVVSERGTEYQRRTAVDEDEILYWLVSSMTRVMAVKWECKNRIPNTDSRIGWMKKDIEILESISSEWANHKTKEYEQILERFPHIWDSQSPD